MACDVLRPVYDATERRRTASSRSRSSPRSRTTPRARIASARDLWSRVDRPNVMIKIPGTEEGVPAIEDAIADGINVNVTLLFSVESYEAIAEAYIRGLERRKEAGESLDVALRRELLRLARRLRGRQAPREARPRGPAGHRRRGERPRRLHALQGALPRRALRRAARGRRRRCSARCGPRPASRTRRTRRPSTSTSWWRPTR